jgi:cytochrome c oxidase assembly factor CtaG
MNSATRLIFAEWSPPWLLSAMTIGLAVIYTRGFFAIRKTRPGLFPDWRLGTFLLGLLTLWLSIGSPLDGFADALLSAHMVQHFLLMSVVPPLLLLGAPLVPMVRGLPRGFVRIVLGPLFSSQPLVKMARFLTLPVVGWLAMNLAYLLWHVPAAYDDALWNQPVHRLEHVCFLTTSFLFWFPVIAPWPARRRYGWVLLPYLLTADFVNTALAAFLIFCDRTVYQYYVVRPNPFHADPLSDQRLGGAIMWVIGSTVFLVPAAGITFRLLKGQMKVRRG